MAMTIKPYQTYGSAVEMLESIGLTDVKQTWIGTSGTELDFKFPDGTEVKTARLEIGNYTAVKAKLMYDLDAHMIFAYDAASTPVADVAFDTLMDNVVLMFVIPSETGTLRKRVPSGKWGATFNVCTDIVADTQPGTEALLLPAYAPYGASVKDLKDCYVSLNTVYPPCQKFVDETGAKWIALGGPLLYKVPTIE